MCVEKQKIKQLIELFPQTATNIKERAKDRRIRFMTQKNINSTRFNLEKQKLLNKYNNNENQEKFLQEYEELLQKDVTRYHTDEEAENQASQKEDMKQFLNKMNKRIDNLVDALKKADSMISKQKDHK